MWRGLLWAFLLGSSLAGLAWLLQGKLCPKERLVDMPGDSSFPTLLAGPPRGAGKEGPL